MKSCIVILTLVVLCGLSCQTVPITGRQQINVVPSESVLSMSFDNYSKFMREHKVITHTEDAAMVRRVGQRIQQAVERYFHEHNLSERLKGYAWEFNLVEGKEINAWCMPGGKVVVYTGILPVARDEAGLAVVMGHEIAHAVAQHGDERLSQALLAELGGMALSLALAQHPSQTNDLFLAAYGAGATVGVLLPYSRLQENEADRLGLIFMAMAGYDPRAAVDFWKRMAASKKGSASPEFLSTHPTDTNRIRNIETLVPEAMSYYRS
jgi:predicted Zn-dependent protease